MFVAAWRAVPGQSFLWRQWDDELVLYHDESGDTHRLNAFTRRALDLLGGQALTPAELAARLAGELEGNTGEAWTASIANLVERLYDLGLVEPAE